MLRLAKANKHECFFFYLLADSWLQLSLDLVPTYLLQVRQLPNDQHRAILWLRVAGRRLKLQHHASHFGDSGRRMAVDQREDPATAADTGQTPSARFGFSFQQHRDRASSFPLGESVFLNLNLKNKKR